MIITKMALPRRTFLRGMGVTLGLPLLDAMIPALTAMAQTPASPVRRLGCYYYPNGYIPRDWIPTTVGSGFELSPILKSLAPVRDQVLVLSGLDHLEANSKGDGTADHPRATAVWLSGVHAWSSTDGLAGEATLGTTLDQIAAKELGKDAPVLSLEMALETPTQVACDSGDCFYSNTISWRTPTMPLPMATHPRVVFARLFGDGGSPAQRSLQTRKTRNILDSVTEEIVRLEQRLDTSDRSKLNEYLQAVRDIEQRIQSLEKRGVESATELPERPMENPEFWDDRARLMFDLQVLAFQADVTRVFTMLMGREQSPQTFPQIGVPENHHSLSHHMDNPNLMAKKAKIDAHYIAQFAYFLEKLRATPDGDGTLLDHSLLLYGSGLGNPNLHEHTNLACLLAGGGAGTVKGGRHLQYPSTTPMANLLLTVLDKLGIPTPEKIGDSTGHLSGI
jgi:uncharacterized protein DUF1552